MMERAPRFLWQSWPTAGTGGLGSAGLGKTRDDPCLAKGGDGRIGAEGGVREVSSNRK